MKMLRTLTFVATLIVAPVLASADDLTQPARSLVTPQGSLELSVGAETAQSFVTSFVKEVNYLSESAAVVSRSFAKYCRDQFDRQACKLTKLKAESIADTANALMLTLPQGAYDSECRLSAPSLPCVTQTLARARSEMLHVTTASAGS